MGIAMGLAASALFGLGAVFVKIGMRRRAVDNGHFMSVLVNVIFLATLMLWVSVPAWDWVGFGAFILAGLMTTWVGRGTSFVAIRLLGPARQGAVLVSAPVFAAVAGWIVLGEGITLIQAMGGVLVSAGLLVLLRSRMEREGGPVAEDTIVADVEQPTGSGVATRLRPRLGRALQSDEFVRGFVFAVLAAVFFGCGFVVRKWGLSYLPSPVVGAFLGTCTAIGMIVARNLVSGNIRQLIDDNFRDIPWWFVAGGIMSSAGMILQFSSFRYVPAWVVSLLQGTQAVWTLLWAWLFLRRDEQITRGLLVSIGLVVAGVAVMTYGV